MNTKDQSSTYRLYADRFPLALKTGVANWSPASRVSPSRGFLSRVVARRRVASLETTRTAFYHALATCAPIQYGCKCGDDYDACKENAVGVASRPRAVLDFLFAAVHMRPRATDDRVRDDHVAAPAGPFPGVRVPPALGSWTRLLFAGGDTNGTAAAAAANAFVDGLATAGRAVLDAVSHARDLDRAEIRNAQKQMHKDARVWAKAAGKDFVANAFKVRAWIYSQFDEHCAPHSPFREKCETTASYIRNFLEIAPACWKTSLYLYVASKGVGRARGLLTRR